MSLCSSFVYRPYHFFVYFFCIFCFSFLFSMLLYSYQKQTSPHPHTHTVFSNQALYKRTNPHLPLKQRNHILPNTNTNITVPIPNSTPPFSQRTTSRSIPVSRHVYIHIYKVDSCFLPPPTPSIPPTSKKKKHIYICKYIYQAEQIQISNLFLYFFRIYMYSYSYRIRNTSYPRLPNQN